MRLGSGVAVAVVQAGGYSSDSASSLGTSIGLKCGPKKTKKKNYKKLIRNFPSPQPGVTSIGFVVRVASEPKFGSVTESGDYVLNNCMCVFLSWPLRIFFLWTEIL